MRIAQALIALSLFATFDVAAHEDRLLTVGPDGSLNGLPEPYLPATLRVSPKAILRIGPREVTLPECLVAGVALRKTPLRVSASWYHELALLPPYVNLQVMHTQGSRGDYTGYSLLFNLETLALIEINRVTVEATEEALFHRQSKVPVESLCGKEQLKEMAPHAPTKPAV